MTNWIEVVHRETGGHTFIPERALPGFRRRGWDVRKPSPVPRVPLIERDTPVETESSDNDSEENE